jgi:hypothetical protein
VSGGVQRPGGRGVSRHPSFTVTHVIPASTDPVMTEATNPAPLTVRARRKVTTVHTPTHVPNSTASQPGCTVRELSHDMCLLPASTAVIIVMLGGGLSLLGTDAIHR